MDKLNAAEAIYGFAAWLSTRKEAISVGSSCDCAQIIRLVEEFTEANELDQVRHNYHVYLKHPKE